MSIDRTGQRFGRLVCVKRIRTPKRTYYECVCDCGNIKTAEGSNLLMGYIRSCGCFQRESTSKRFRKHGFAHSPNRQKKRMYECWCNMKRRCLDPKNEAWENYGGRGIVVCQKWLDSFEGFLEDMGLMPLDMTIDRIDSNGNYEKSNCKWASDKEQADNTRRNLWLTCQGVTKTLTDWGRHLGVSRCAIKYQIRKRGEEATILYFLYVKNKSLD